MTHINNVIVFSDLHIGCRLGLCSPSVIADEGVTFGSSKAQKKVWGLWKWLWDVWVPEVTHGEDFAVVANGDIIDGVHHRSVTQWSQNLSDQRKVAEEILKPIVARCKGKFFVIRGTEAHSGKSGQDEEELARHLKAIPDECSRSARYELWLKIGKGRCHFLHHIGTTGSNHYESTAVMKELAECYSEAGRWGHYPPDVVVRSHRHRHIEVRVPTKLGYGIAFVTAGWQLKTPFSYKIPGGRITQPQFGLHLIRQGDSDLYTRHKVFDIERPKEVVL